MNTGHGFEMGQAPGPDREPDPDRYLLQLSEQTDIGLDIGVHMLAFERPDGTTEWEPSTRMEWVRREPEGDASP